MTTLLSPQTTLAYMAYLGFPGSDTRLALQTLRSHTPTDRQRRSIFLVLVVGSVGAGKTSLLRAFLGRPFGEEGSTYVPTLGGPKYAVDEVTLPGVSGQPRRLVLMEASPHDGCDERTIANTNLMDLVDAVCFVYNASDADSFEYVVSMREKHSAALERCPAIVVASKADLVPVRQGTAVQPEEYCRLNGIPAPLCVSVAENQTGEVFEALAEAVIHPAFSTDPAYTRAGRALDLQDQTKRRIFLGLTLGGSLAAAALLASILYHRVLGRRT
jgi:Ras family protein T1